METDEARTGGFYRPLTSVLVTVHRLNAEPERAKHATEGIHHRCHRIRLPTVVTARWAHQFGKNSRSMVKPFRLLKINFKLKKIALFMKPGKQITWLCLKPTGPVFATSTLEIYKRANSGTKKRG